MALVHADLRVGLVALLARHHEGRHARDVRLIGEREQVVHQLDVLFELEWDADRRRRQLERRVSCCRSAICDAPLDLAHALEVVVHARAILRAEAPLQAGDLLRDGVEDAAIFLGARRPLRRGAALAEHPLEHLPRIDLHRHGRGRRPPRQRVHVDAAVVAVARADQARLIFGRQLDRRQQRLLADSLRRNLVRRDPRVSVERPGSASAAHRSTTSSGSASAPPCCRRRGGRGRSPRRDDSGTARAASGSGRTRSPRPRSPASTCPCSRRAADRRTPDATRAFAAVFASSVRAGTIASSRGSASVAPTPRRNVRRGRCFLVMNMSDSC